MLTSAALRCLRHTTPLFNVPVLSWLCFSVCYVTCYVTCYMLLRHLLSKSEDAVPSPLGGCLPAAHVMQARMQSALP